MTLCPLIFTDFGYGLDHSPLSRSLGLETMDYKKAAHSGLPPARRVKALLSKLLVFGGANTESRWGNHENETRGFEPDGS